MPFETDAVLRRAHRFLPVLATALALLGCTERERENLIAGKTPSALTGTHFVQRIADGIAAAPGAPWDSELAAQIEVGGGVNWDLGRIERIGRVYIQADHNDLYAVLASTDGRRWTRVFEAGPVPAIGLQPRSATGLDVRARFVRLEPSGGDAMYSVAELVVARAGAGAWPPALEQRDGARTNNPSYPKLDGRMRLSALFALAVLAPWALIATPRGRRTRVLLGLSGAALALFVIVAAMSYAAGYRFNLVDDAYISLQYAKNWIDGHGLVFNPGERVEGYTNFLWIALCAPFWPLTGRDPLLFTRASISLAIGLAAIGVLLLLAIGRRLFGSAVLPALFAAAWLAFDDSYVAYAAMFGLENHLLIALMFGGLALFAYQPPRFVYGLGLSFALCAMTRPDALLWPATFFLIQLIELARRPRAGEPANLDFRTLQRAAAAFLVPFAIYFAARWAYFGELLPNTFHLKVGRDLNAVQRGLDYVQTYLAERSYVPLVALLAPVVARTAVVWWLTLFTLLHTAYVVYVGGDFYGGHRFLLVVTPCCALLAGAVLDRLLRARPHVSVRAVSTALALSALLVVQYGSLRFGPYTTELHHFAPTVDANVQFMRWLKRVARPNASMVVGDIGAAGLFADLRVIDVYGVVDPNVARRQVKGFGKGKAGHEKIASLEERLRPNPTFLKWGYVPNAPAPRGYYLFNDFPRELRVEGLWVRDDRSQGRPLFEPALSLEGGALAAWTRTGDAFTRVPSRRRQPGQEEIAGQVGSFINSFAPGLGDAATGRLVSPKFVLTGDRMRLLVGGGRDEERLRVSLLVEDRRVFSATGTFFETLGRREWNIAPYKGKQAQIEIVDDADGAWGHILVDEIVQWLGPPAAGGEL